MAPRTIPLTTALTTTFTNLISRAVSSGKCEPPGCKPATKQQTIIIASCFAGAMVLILPGAFWYHWRNSGREEKGKFEKVGDEDGDGNLGSTIAAADGIVVAASSHHGGSGNTANAIGGNSGGSSLFSF